MRRKHGVRALVLTTIAAALGLMAFGGVGAQAQLPGESTKGTFLVNNKVLLASVTGSLLGEGKLLVQGRNLDLKCSGAHVEEGHINATGTEALVKVLFLGCKTYVHNSKEQIKNCIIKGGTVEGGGTIIAIAIVLPIFHGGSKFVLFESDGGPLATISYEANKGCVLPLNNPVTGSVTAEVIEGTPTTLIFSEAIQLLNGDELFDGVFRAYITATAHVEGSGAHAGQRVGIH